MAELEVRSPDYPWSAPPAEVPPRSLPKTSVRGPHPVVLRPARSASPPSKEPRWKKLGSLAALVVSVLLHAALIYTLFSRALPPSVSDEGLPPVEITALDRAAPGADDQIVFTERSDEAGPLPLTPYLSDRDQVVEKESRRAVPAPASESTDSVTPGTDSAQAPTMGDLGIDAAGTTGVETEDSGMHSMASDWRIDSLEKVPLGPRTLLNTKRYAHFAYYKRMKERLAPIWQPEAQRRVRSLWITGRHPKTKKLATAVAVGVDSEGVVKFVELVKGSGFSNVDDAAVDAFFKARSFPNPPQALLNDAGELSMRWNFVVDVEGIENIPLPEERETRQRDFR